MPSGIGGARAISFVVIRTSILLDPVANLIAREVLIYNGPIFASGRRLGIGTPWGIKLRRRPKPMERCPFFCIAPDDCHAGSPAPL